MILTLRLELPPELGALLARVAAALDAQAGTSGGWEPKWEGSLAALVPAEALHPAGKSPAPADHPMQAPDWLTPERRAVLRAGWPGGVQTYALRQRLEALPGPALPKNGAIATRAANIGLRRPGWFRPAVGMAARLGAADAALAGAVVERVTRPGATENSVGPVEAAGIAVSQPEQEGTPAATPVPAEAPSAAGQSPVPADRPSQGRGGQGQAGQGQAGQWQDWVTPARGALLRAGWAGGVQIFDLRHQMAQLPGPPLPHNTIIAQRVSGWGLRRPAGFLSLSGWAAKRAADARASPPVASPPAASPPADNRVEIVRNTARPPPLLPARHAPPPPPVSGAPAVPAHLAERDGHFSMARAQEAADAADVAAVPVTLADALLWGARNGAAPAEGERPPATFARVNARRIALGLPPYRLVPPRGISSTPLPGPGLGGSATRDAA